MGSRHVSIKVLVFWFSWKTSQNWLLQVFRKVQKFCQNFWISDNAWILALKWDSIRCLRFRSICKCSYFFELTENLEFLFGGVENGGVKTSIYSWHLPKMLGGKTSMNLSDLDFKVSWRKKLHKNFHFPKFYLSHNHSRFASWSWKSYSRKKYHSVDLNSLTQVRTIISPVSKFGQSEPPKILFGAKNAQNQVLWVYKL